MCVCVCVCVCVYTPHLLYPSVDGHLGYFHFLGIVNNAPMNIGMHMSFQISIFLFSLGVYPGMELMDHVLYLII